MQILHNCLTLPSDRNMWTFLSWRMFIVKFDAPYKCHCPRLMRWQLFGKIPSMTIESDRLVHGHQTESPEEITIRMVHF